MKLAAFNPAFALNETSGAALRKNFYAVPKNAAEQRDMFTSFAKENMERASNNPCATTLDGAAKYMNTAEEFGQVANITSHWTEEVFKDKSDDDILIEMLSTASDYALRAVFSPSLAPITKRLVNAISEATHDIGIPSLNGFHGL